MASRQPAQKSGMVEEPSEQLFVPAHVQAYKEVLGADLAADFLLRFGGAEVYFSKSPTLRSAAAGMIGLEKMSALGKALGFGQIAVPTAKKFVAEILLRRGVSIADIARTLHMDQSRVRRWLGPRPADRQLSFFDDI